MVGYSKDDTRKLTTTDYALAGALTGASSRAFGQPLDVLKIRFQLQVEPISGKAKSKYTGISQAVKTIVKEEGLKALWKGHVPAQLLSIIYGSSQFASFELCTKLVSIHLPENLSTDLRPVTHTVCGGIAACVAMALSHPADLLRTRLIAQGHNKFYRSIPVALTTILKTEGPMGFYKGLCPSLLMIAPQMGLQFGFYTTFKDLWNFFFHFFNHKQYGGLLQNGACGAAAGVVSKTLIYPLDLCKKRLEIRDVEDIRKDFGATRKYFGLSHCIKEVAREEGWMGLFKGLSPSLLKAAFMSMTNFAIYELLCEAFSKKNDYFS